MERVFTYNVSVPGDLDVSSRATGKPTLDSCFFIHVSFRFENLANDAQSGGP